MEINNKIIRKELEVTKTLEYFLEHINGGGALGDIILQQVDFPNGAFFIFLLEVCRIESLYKFSSGGINPLVEVHPGDYKQNEGYTGTARLTTYDHVSEYIKKYLDSSEDHRLICEDVIQSPGDPQVEIPKIEAHFYEKHVYYSLSKGNSIEEILMVIKKTDYIWHSLIVLYKGVNLPKTLTPDCLDAIVSGVQFIITSAHDGENCIFWERGFT